MVNKLWVRAASLFFSTCLFQACMPKIVPYTDQERFTSETGIPDYQSLDYWAAHPDKWDPADSTQKEIGTKLNHTGIGVFFLHPTSYTDGTLTDGLPANARIDDPYLNKKTDYTSILYQASIFNQIGDVYAPRYRQAHISLYYEKDTMKAKMAFELAYQDVKIAFGEFLKMNKDKPFVIASHSQGTTHAARLIAEIIDPGPLRDKMIAAYLVGMPVPKKMFSNVKICRDSSETGCFVSWRTFADGYTNPYISTSDTSIGIVNPIVWTTDSRRSVRNEHHGAILYNFQKIYRRTHTAQVLGNALFISKPRFPGSFLIKMQNYHAGDYNLFYVNIKEDVERRIRLFNEKKETGTY